MGAIIFVAASTLLVLLGPPLGLLLLAFRRTRRSAAFILLLPPSATGGAIFGFWLVGELLHGRVSPQRALEGSFFLGGVLFYALGLTLALIALLFRPNDRTGAWLKSAVNGTVAGFVVPSCVALLTFAKMEIALRHQNGAVGWDPVSLLNSTTWWQLLPVMLTGFLIVVIWSARALRTSTS